MNYAVAYPEPEKGKRTDLFGDRKSPLKAERVSLARAVGVTKISRRRSPL
jgi:hypothetical protein